MVSLVDGLEQRGLLERTRNAEDRRLYAVHLTQPGRELLGEIRAIAAKHNSTMLAALDPSERDQLHALLSRVAAEQNLTPGVHPGYRTLGSPDPA
jgi:DNA-binding MarR family transcriptional regulator